MATPLARAMLCLAAQPRLPRSTCPIWDGTNGFQINGIDAYDYFGRSVSSAGDVNGDGYDDLIVGAYGGDPNGDSQRRGRAMSCLAGADPSGRHGSRST